MQFSEITVLVSHGKIATSLHGALTKFADRKLTRIFRVYIFSAIFQKMNIACVTDRLRTEVCMCDGNAIVS